MMPSSPKLTEEQIQEALAQLDGWELHQGKLHRKLVFKDFREALGFMVSVGCAAEAQNHHPEWSNVYNRVEVWLTTHDAGGLTQKDLALAAEIDRRAPGKSTHREAR